MSADRKRPLPLKGSSLLWTGLAAVLVACAAAWLLAPSGAGDPPAAVQVADYFDREMLEEAGEYRSDRRTLALAALGCELLALAAVALRRGRRSRALLDRLGRRPLLGSMAVGAGLALLVTLVRLPFDLVAFRLGRDRDLLTQSVGGWATDLLISTAISVAIAAVAALIAVWLWRRFRRRFWVAGSLLVAGYAVLFVWLWPVVISPVFNDFEPLPQGEPRREVLRLAQEAGVDVGEVYVVDASRRSSTLNAYVNGIGSTKRVVIYDNAIDGLTPAELEALIAHELAHVESNDLYRGLAFALLSIPLGVLFVQMGTAAVTRRTGDDPSGPGVVPALALMTLIATTALTVPGNSLSRSVETHADRFAVELTGDPRGMIELQRRLAIRNLSDPDPPGAYQFVFGTHPSALDRIAVAEAELRKGRGDR